MRNRSVQRSSFATSMRLTFIIGLRGAQQDTSMKKRTFFIAKLSGLGIFHISSSVCIVFLTLSKYKQNVFYFWRSLLKRLSVTSWEYVYSFTISGVFSCELELWSDCFLPFIRKMSTVLLGWYFFSVFGCDTVRDDQSCEQWNKFFDKSLKLQFQSKVACDFGWKLQIFFKVPL